MNNTLAVVAGLLTGVVAGLITALIAKGSTKKVQISVAVALLIAVAVIVLIPRLPAVPKIEGMYRDQAEQCITDAGMKISFAPGSDDKVKKDCVIPGTVDPPPGTRVHPSAVVRAALSMGTPAGVQDGPPGSGRIIVMAPKDGASVALARQPDGTFRFTASGIAANHGRLLFWVRPVEPAAEVSGYYLQRPPNGITSFLPDGTWQASGQLGNATYPPHGGDTFDVLVTAVPEKEADKLQRRPGVIIETNPPGSLGVAEVRGVKVGM